MTHGQMSLHGFRGLSISSEKLAPSFPKSGSWVSSSLIYRVETQLNFIFWVRYLFRASNRESSPRGNCWRYSWIALGDRSNNYLFDLHGENSLWQGKIGKHVVSCCFKMLITHIKYRNFNNSIKIMFFWTTPLTVMPLNQARYTCLEAPQITRIMASSSITPWILIQTQTPHLIFMNEFKFWLPRATQNTQKK